MLGECHLSRRDAHTAVPGLHRTSTHNSGCRAGADRARGAGSGAGFRSPLTCTVATPCYRAPEVRCQQIERACWPPS